MDVLIHLIIWIFRTLFGEQEPAAKLGPRERYDSDRERNRGPYDYGDGRRPGGGQAKTLAELLEEARRQAEGRTAAPPEPAYTPPPAPEPAPYLPPPPAPAPYIPPPPEPRQVRRKKKRRRVEQPAEAPQLAATPIEAERAAAELVAAAAARPRRPRPSGSADYAVALSTATPEQRVVIGRQAIVLMEIFGPPRCRRAFRRGV